MKTAEKLAAGWLLTLGFMFLTLSAYALDQKHKMLQPIPSGMEESLPDFVSRDFVNKDALYLLDNTALNGIIFGFPTSLLGLWLALGYYRQAQREKKVLKEQVSDKLQSTFYRMIEANNGRITLLSFAMHSQLPPAQARHYLDEQARLFNANFKVSEEGGISYHFDI
jgi:hypothetical protein